MRAGDPVKRFGRADKARRLAGPSDPPVLLNPPPQCLTESPKLPPR